jgi:hypothetical protein
MIAAMPKQFFEEINMATDYKIDADVNLVLFVIKDLKQGNYDILEERTKTNS